MKKVLLIFLVMAFMVAGCTGQQNMENEMPDRSGLIPATQPKIAPESDLLPPILHSSGYAQPVPLPYPVNTAGAEDSAFIMPDGNTLYFWFTPNPAAPLGEQLEDGVTGIWVSKKENGVWQEAERILLQDQGKQALDGCVFVQDDVMWFCSARTGFNGMHWFQAHKVDGTWDNWEIKDFNPDYDVGELHITTDGSRLYFHSSRPGGMGQYDIWVCRNIDGTWQEPENLAAVNSPEVEGWPFITPDGGELWFTRFYKGSPAIFRSRNVDGQWQEPELIISQFAGEASLDSAGNIYLTHHFYKDGIALEADIYVARKLP